MFMKRKNAVTALIVLFICIAVYLNWNYTGQVENVAGESADAGKTLGEATLTSTGSEDSANEEKTNENDDVNTSADDYFTKARLEKQRARDSALTILKDTTEKEDVSQEERDKAAANMESMATGAVSEARIETLVKAKGFRECVALINDETVNVIVQAPDGGLTASDSTKIKDIVMSETKVNPSQIKIVEIK